MLIVNTIENRESFRAGWLVLNPVIQWVKIPCKCSGRLPNPIKSHGPSDRTPRPTPASVAMKSGIVRLDINQIRTLVAVLAFSTTVPRRSPSRRETPCHFNTPCSMRRKSPQTFGYFSDALKRTIYDCHCHSSNNHTHRYSSNITFL